jgi:hypothetical protein
MKIQYVANNGRVFGTEAECRQYEDKMYVTYDYVKTNPGIYEPVGIGGTRLVTVQYGGVYATLFISCLDHQCFTVADDKCWKNYEFKKIADAIARLVVSK